VAEKCTEKGKKEKIHGKLKRAKGTLSAAKGRCWDPRRKKRETQWSFTRYGPRGNGAPTSPRLWETDTGEKEFPTQGLKERVTVSPIVFLGQSGDWKSPNGGTKERNV